MPLRCLALLGVLATVACGAPGRRLPLPVPFMPVAGATPHALRGVTMGFEEAGAHIGPEFRRGQVRGFTLGAAAANAVSFGVTWPNWQTRTNGAAGHSGVEQVRGKVRLAQAFSGRAVLAAHGSHTWGERFAVGALEYENLTGTPALRQDTLQDDRVRSTEVALPMELLIGRRFADAHTSVYAGPRLVHIAYRDAIRPDGTFNALVPGAFLGVHLSGLVHEISLEATVAYLPGRVYGGGNVGGHLTIMPALAASIRFGQPYRWGF